MTSHHGCVVTELAVEKALESARVVLPLLLLLLCALGTSRTKRRTFPCSPPRTSRTSVVVDTTATPWSRWTTPSVGDGLCLFVVRGKGALFFCVHRGMQLLWSANVSGSCGPDSDAVWVAGVIRQDFGQDSVHGPRRKHVRPGCCTVTLFWTFCVVSVAAGLTMTSTVAVFRHQVRGVHERQRRVVEPRHWFNEGQSPGRWLQLAVPGRQGLDVGGK